MEMAEKVYTGVKEMDIEALRTVYHVSLYRVGRKTLLADVTLSVKGVKLRGEMKVEMGRTWPDGKPTIHIQFPRARKVKVDEFDTLKVGY